MSQEEYCINEDEEEQEQEEPTESSALLARMKESTTYKIPPSQYRLTTTIPILYCLTSPRVLLFLLLLSVLRPPLLSPSCTGVIRWCLVWG
jgi:hypothetical protein